MIMRLCSVREGGVGGSFRRGHAQARTHAAHAAQRK